MWLISNCLCFWLLLMLSFSQIGVVFSDMYCYHCRNEDKECPDTSRPFNTIPCTDPSAVCLILTGHYEVGTPDVFYRGCAHPDWIAAMGGKPNTCTEQKLGSHIWNMMFSWIRDNPTKYTGGTQTFIRVKSSLEYVICTCDSTNKCNDIMGTVGEPYPPPKEQPPILGNGNTQCVCDDNENKCPDKDKRGKSGSEDVHHHFPSAVALGGVIILSVWRAVYNHMDIF